MRRIISAVVAAAVLLVLASTPTLAEPATGGRGSDDGHRSATVTAALRSDLDHYLGAYRSAEHISGVSVAVTFRHHPALDLSVGTTRDDGGGVLWPHALWQIGSNTKAFTSVLLLQLEAEHRLSIDDTLGRWLPQYPAWSQVTIRQLLDMTSGIPNYTDAAAFWLQVAAAPDAELSAPQLVAFAVDLPATHGYSYSNTNYILAQMIIERATHDSYAGQLRRRIFVPLGLHDTFYSATTYGPWITARMPAGYWFVAPLPGPGLQMGEDTSHQSVSWAQGAGGIVSSLQDLVEWNRALLTGRVLPRVQQRELTSLVSAATGNPIMTTTSTDDAGYGLGVSQVTSTSLGTIWYYEGETDGYRVLNMYSPRSGTAVAIGVNSATFDDHTSELGTSVHQTLQAAGLA